MNKKRIKHITRSYHREIQRLINRVNKKFDTEKIHQFRVSYKKLRALLRMLSRESKIQGNLKITKKLKSCYQLAGAIRDLQLQQEQVLKFAQKQPVQLPAYLQLIQIEIDKLKPQFSILIAQNPVSENKKKIIAAIPNNCSAAQFKTYAGNKWKDIHSLIAANSFTDKNMHTIRKNLKDLFYNHGEFKRVELKFLPHSKHKKGRQYIKLLLDELGVLQDWQVAISLLKAPWLKKPGRGEIELLRQMKKEWAKDKRSIKRLLLTKLKTISPV